MILPVSAVRSELALNSEEAYNSFILTDPPLKTTDEISKYESSWVWFVDKDVTIEASSDSG